MFFFVQTLFKHTIHHVCEYLRYQVTGKDRKSRIKFCLNLANPLRQVDAPLNLANKLSRLCGAPVDQWRSGESR